MMFCFSDRCYVPLLRATDNTSQPIIGDPWSPESSEGLTQNQQHTRSPMDPLMTVTAFAGPLSPFKASLSPVCMMVGLFSRFWWDSVVFHWRQLIFDALGRRHPESGPSSTTSLNQILTEGQKKWAGTNKPESAAFTFISFFCLFIYFFIYFCARAPVLTFFKPLLLFSC